VKPRLSREAACPKCGITYLVPTVGPCLRCGSERPTEPALLPPKTLRRIVAEVSKTWPDPTQREPTLLAERFELVIATNAERGFALESWRLQAYAVRSPKGEEGIVETIVAVFVEVP
jgi:hypothetical protein